MRCELLTVAYWLNRQTHSVHSGSGMMTTQGMKTCS